MIVIQQIWLKQFQSRKITKWWQILPQRMRIRQEFNKTYRSWFWSYSIDFFFLLMLKKISQTYFANFSNTKPFSFGLIAGFDICPEFKTDGNCVHLIHDGYRFSKNRTAHDRAYWRCVGYRRNKCSARIVTKKVNGWDVANVVCSAHSHSNHK